MSGPLPAFAAHLAALGRLPDPEDRGALRVLAAVVQDWTWLASTSNPSFELDGGTLWVGGEALALPPPWREALAPLEAALRAHGAGGVRLVGPVDRSSVLALLRGARALPPAAPREELQRWVTGHGGATLQLLAARPATARDPRAGLAASLRAWNRLAATVDGSAANRRDAVQRFVERVLAEPRSVPPILAVIGPRPVANEASVAALALLVGGRLGLGRDALVDLGFAAMDVAALSMFGSEDLARRELDRLEGPLGRSSARRLLAASGQRAAVRRHRHLFARICALANDTDELLRGPDRLLPDQAMVRLEAQSGPNHEPALVDAMLAILGRYPVGSTLLLESGEVGVVCRPPGTPEHVSHPIVRIVLDRTGTLVGGAAVLDLSAAGPGRARIIGALDPARLQIDVLQAILG